MNYLAVASSPLTTSKIYALFPYNTYSEALSSLFELKQKLWNEDSIFRHNYFQQYNIHAEQPPYTTLTKNIDYFVQVNLYVLNPDDDKNYIPIFEESYQNILKNNLENFIATA